MHFSRFSGLLLILFALTACGGTDNKASSSTQATTEALTMAQAVEITNPRIRSVAPGQTVTGAFMTLSNTADEAITLSSAQADIAAVTELHETSMQDGVMKMQKLEKIVIPARGQSELKPGGLHMMLINLQETPAKGDKVPLTLNFADDSSQTIEATVMDVMK